jgi:hypothetical protein
MNESDDQRLLRLRRCEQNVTLENGAMREEPNERVGQKEREAGRSPSEEPVKWRVMRDGKPKQSKCASNQRRRPQLATSP